MPLCLFVVKVALQNESWVAVLSFLLYKNCFIDHQAKNINQSHWDCNSLPLLWPPRSAHLDSFRRYSACSNRSAYSSLSVSMETTSLSMADSGSESCSPTNPQQKRNHSHDFSIIQSRVCITWWRHKSALFVSGTAAPSVARTSQLTLWTEFWSISFPKTGSQWQVGDSYTVSFCARAPLSGPHFSVCRCGRDCPCVFQDCAFIAMHSVCVDFHGIWINLSSFGPSVTLKET